MNQTRDQLLLPPQVNGGGYISVEWPAPASVHAVSSTRLGGGSTGCYRSNNLGEHVGESLKRVQQNRQQLQQQLALPAAPLWLNQVHGDQVILAEKYKPGCLGDAMVAKQLRQVCVVMTADCLPILLSSRCGTVVAAVHGGWRSLAAGILDKTIFACEQPMVFAWLGPAISQPCFEVSEDVYQAFKQRGATYEAAFISSRSGHYWADLYMLARINLVALGVEQIYGGDYCTYRQADWFYSYRRDGQATGRQASFIWMD